MRTTVVAIAILSACFVHNVNGEFLKRTPDDTKKAVTPDDAHAQLHMTEGTKDEQKQHVTLDTKVDKKQDKVDGIKEVKAEKDNEADDDEADTADDTDEEDEEDDEADDDNEADVKAEKDNDGADSVAMQEMRAVQRTDFTHMTDQFAKAAERIAANEKYQKLWKAQKILDAKAAEMSGKLKPAKASHMDQHELRRQKKAAKQTMQHYFPLEDVLKHVAAPAKKVVEQMDKKHVQAEGASDEAKGATDKGKKGDDKHPSMRVPNPTVLIQVNEADEDEDDEADAQAQAMETKAGGQDNEEDNETDDDEGMDDEADDDEDDTDEEDNQADDDNEAD